MSFLFSEPCSVVGRFACLFLLALTCWGANPLASAQQPTASEESPLVAGLPQPDEMLAKYFERETARIEANCLAEITSAEDWQQQAEKYRGQLFEMLGLDPLPEKTDLHATVTGTLTAPGVQVEKLHFQSRPGLYVTANFYLPEQHEGPLPAVLYLCGHGRVVKNGVSYGNKTHYHHHAVWFARHGYACLVIDTLQLGEIEGLHHGTHREGMWWWNSRGYTPAGVEAWNAIRAVDYLQSRPEVDPERIGVTGRSGGGAYSWWAAALDPRIKAAVPVAGITDLRNHVVDGVISGHCDCMFMVNTYGWDYPQVAALVAPRPLLLANSDQDGIFPLDGVVRTQFHLRRLYDLLSARDKLGLHVTSGPHSDTQELQVGAFAWLNRHLQGENPLIRQPAEKIFEPEQLKVFEALPTDERNTTAHEWFVPAAAQPELPETWEEFSAENQRLRQTIREKVFGGWPAEDGPLYPNLAKQVEHDGLILRAWDFTSQPGFRLRVFTLVEEEFEDEPQRVDVRVLGEEGWKPWASVAEKFLTAPSSDQVTAEDLTGLALDANLRQGEMLVVVTPRGVGPSAWGGDERARTHQRRRFMLLGQTLPGMQAWDIRRAIQLIQQHAAPAGARFTVEGSQDLTGVLLYAAMFSEGIDQLTLHVPDAASEQGPELLNVLRFLDLPRAAAIVAEETMVEIRNLAVPSFSGFGGPPPPEGWEYLYQAAERFPDQVQML